MKRRSAALAAAVVCLAALRAWSAPPWPDDWDGVGFVLSIARFDLARFTPHPPGYPVYVAMLRAAALVFRSPPVLAANGVAVVSGAVSFAALAWAATRALGVSRAIWVAGFASLAPLAWRAGSAVGSESPALMLVCFALLGATWRTNARGAALAIGACVGLGLGVRLSWAPLFVALLAIVPSGERVRACTAAAIATLVWAIPFVAIVGPAELASLVRTHASGHFETWGGTAITDPGAAARVAYLARDLFVDGLGADGDVLGIGIAVVAVVLVGLAIHTWRARAWAEAPVALRAVLLVLPYLAWIALGQNVRAQPRHALPLVVAIAAALGIAAESSRATRALGAALLAAITLRTALDARDRRAIPPVGAQLVALADSFARDAGSTAVYAGPSARFFELAPSPDVTAQTVGSLGDARLALGRLASLPSRVLVTSELEGVPSSRQVSRVATLCRPPRIDRRAPCIDVYEWKALR